ncbi:MAG TPA: PSD1 and planctomycete cytochrome C domain-containing protein [Bryobacteraceae bacterium]|nr:PSD1 and planctomycete cytochrome C domain-containing protein [Bryobacteraceae bacterium]
MFRFSFCLLLGALSVPAADNAELFRVKIQPILQSQCGSCHSGKQPQSDFSVDNYATVLKGGKHGQAITPGSSKQSALLAYMRGDKTPRMPLGGQLPDATIAEIARAIDELTPEKAEAQANRDSHMEWLLKAPKRPDVPKVTNTAFVKNSIDAFVVAKLESKGLTPAPRADRRALLRRLYFDLLGVPPSLEEAKAFLSDESADAYERLVDKLLADPRYGERWARHWLDLARYAESDGFAVDTERPTAWRYRDYVVRSFQQDKPYDQFVKEQIAGDEIRGNDDRSERLVATGFLRMGTWEADATSKQQLRQDFLNEITGTTSSVFLGLTVGCAQCHNHKYDPIPQRDFYRLQAFFAATGVDELPAPFLKPEDPLDKKRRFRDLEDAWESATAQLDKRREELKARFIALKKVKEDDASVKEFLRELNVANAFFQERQDAIFQTEEWKRYSEAKDEVQKLNERMRRFRPVAYAVHDLVPPNVPDLPSTYILAAGELDAKTDKVEAGFPECVTGKAEAAKIPFVGGSSGLRLALAEWIASNENPLTARVMVNRIWQQHFGEGIVRTPSDFGKNGARPSNPELLDWLATEFISKGWSIKAMHRLMLTSNTYRQSVHNPNLKQFKEIDPNNELLWRMNWHRLDAESLRDTLLSVGGKLNPAAGGPGALLNVPPDVAEGFEFFKWFPSSDDEQRRRTIYTFQRRSVIDPVVEVFDGANMSQSCSRRIPTVVAPQALTLLNGELSMRMSEALAERIVERTTDRDAQIDKAFWIVLQRSPSDAERAKGQQLFTRFPAKQALANLGLALFNTNEFLYLE